MSKAPATKPKQAKYKKFMLVRYSRMSTLGLFEHHETRLPKVDTRVVVKTDKGLELGYLVGQLSSYRAGQFKFDSDEIKKYFEDSNIDISVDQSGKFVRYATAADISEERHLKKIAEEEMECCRRFVKELDLPMKIVDAEHIFGGERVIFYFMSDGRVDFRELVKKIAHEYQTRIEMRQIGSRDEAKILGDVESCGQQCCCQRFLKLLKPVNMRMAKMQKATLDPSKISGYCGRLKCCLRYEDKTYTELKRRLPKKNTKVETKYGEGKVVDTQILTQLVMVELSEGQKVPVPLEELEVLSSPENTKKKKQNNDTENNHRDSRKSETDSQMQDSAEDPEQ
jgi:cell fate regulator YaaT (PSP1 superfamily)